MTTTSHGSRRSVRRRSISSRFMGSPHLDRLADAARLQGRLDGSEDVPAGTDAQLRLAVFVDGPGDVVGQEAIVLDAHAPLPVFLRRLVLVIDTDCRKRLVNHKRAGSAEHVQLDLAAARVTRRPDATDADRPDESAV